MATRFARAGTGSLLVLATLSWPRLPPYFMIKPTTFCDVCSNTILETDPAISVAHSTSPFMVWTGGTSVVQAIRLDFCRIDCLTEWFRNPTKPKDSNTTQPKR